MAVNRRPDSTSDIERAVDLLAKMKSIFGSNGDSNGKSPIMISVKGANGETGGIPLETFFMMQDHQDKRQREQADFTSKQETAKTVRGFFSKIADAASRM